MDVTCISWNTNWGKKVKKQQLHNNLLLIIFWAVIKKKQKKQQQAVVSRVEQSVMTDVQTPLKKGETVLYPIMKASKF